jgi:hypothetical protein
MINDTGCHVFTQINTQQKTVRIMLKPTIISPAFLPVVNQCLDSGKALKVLSVTFTSFFTCKIWRKFSERHSQAEMIDP